MHFNFLQDAVMIAVEGAATAGTSTLTTDVVDTRGFDSVMFVAHLGDVTDTAVLTLTMQMGDESNGSDAADTEVAATFTAGASDADGNLMAIETYKPRQRYVRATLARGTANAVLNGIVAYLFNAHERPSTQDASVIAHEFVSDAALA